MKVMSVLGKMVGIGVIAATSGAAYTNYVSYKKSEDKVKRLDSYYHVCYAWIREKQNKLDLKAVFERLESKKIAIYGMGVLGELFYNELKAQGLECVAFVDKNAEIMGCGYEGVPLVGMDELESCGADTVVVTPVFAYGQIKEEIEAQSRVKVISLDEIYTA